MHYRHILQHTEHKPVTGTVIAIVLIILFGIFSALRTVRTKCRLLIIKAVRGQRRFARNIIIGRHSVKLVAC